MKSFLFFVLCLGCVFAVHGWAFVQSVHYNQNIGGHLKRAADANTVEIAEEELRTALKNIEQSGKNVGNTSLLWEVPSNDCAFWYNNLKTSLTELENLPKTSPAMEKSNMLMKLRETILDHGEHGDRVTQPAGIQVTPVRVAYNIAGWLSALALVISALIMAADNKMLD